jgi:hypothetical protein
LKRFIKRGRRNDLQESEDFMGTRHLIAAYQGGEYKVAQYGQWDGYPEGQGTDLLKFLSNVKIENLQRAVSECRWITKEEIDEIQSQIEKTSKVIPAWDWAKQYPELSRDTGSKIFNLILNGDKKLLKNSLDFANDSLFCEWAYVIDFDKNTFEVYQGFNKSPLNETERFYNENKPDSYFPVKLYTTFDLNNLPSQEDFLNAFKQADDEES